MAPSRKIGPHTSHPDCYITLSSSLSLEEPEFPCPLRAFQDHHHRRRRVGVTCAYALVLKGTAQEIVLINREPKKAEGEAADLQHAVPLGQPVKVTAGNYKDGADSAIVILAAGVPSAVVCQFRWHTSDLAIWHTGRWKAHWTQPV